MSWFSIENFQLFFDLAIDFIPFFVFILNIDFVSSTILPFNPIICGFDDWVISVCNPMNSCDVMLSMVKQAGKGVEEFRPYVTRVIPVGAQIVCADNSGAKILEIINVPRHKTRVSRLPAAAVGDFCNVVVKKGPAELRKTVHGAVIIRQKYAVRRLNGVRVCFEDNAAVLITPEGETRGTDIKGPVAAEASEKWPRVANLASMVV